MYLAWHQLHLLEEVSLTFSRRATGFHRRAKHFNSNFFMVQAGIIILTACRFTWFSALNETPIVVEWWLFSIESWKVAKYIYLGKVKQEPIRQAVTPICVRGLRGDLTACSLPRGLFTFCRFAADLCGLSTYRAIFAHYWLPCVANFWQIIADSCSPPSPLLAHGLR